LRVLWVRWITEVEWYDRQTSDSYYVKGFFISKGTKVSVPLTGESWTMPDNLIVLVKANIRSIAEEIYVLAHELLHFLFFKLHLPETFNEWLDKLCDVLTVEKE